MVGVAGDVVLPSLVSGTAVGVAGDLVLPSLTTALVSLVSGTAVGVELVGGSVIEMAVMEDTTLATVTAARFASRVLRSLCLLWSSSKFTGKKIQEVQILGTSK